jgi:NAD(P)-dependent dehydrogenase (short-subunit alcohol dehydrogenase family)
VRRLEGKIAVITGGAGGIGAATARRFTDEGAKVLVADINQAGADEVAREIGGETSATAYDAADPASIAAMIELAVSRYGRLDILHNNAALTSPEVVGKDTTAPDIPLEIWDAVMAVNLRGYMVGCKYAIPAMLKGGGGAIINTASGSGFVGDLSRIAYGVTKAGAMAITRYVATQHGRQGIRCNAIAPGLILTEASRNAVPELVEIISNHVLTPRLGRPEDVAAVAAFLASDDAGFINGETIRCNGGSLEHQPHTHDLSRLLAQAAG